MHQITPGKPRNHAPHSNIAMDESVERIIRRVLEDARTKGRDHITQTELAVRAVCEARPDMTTSDALAAVSGAAVVKSSGRAIRRQRK